MGNNSEFVEQLRLRAQGQVVEHTKLLCELHRIEMEIARAKKYLDDLNEFLKSEGQLTVPLE